MPEFNAPVASFSKPAVTLRTLKRARTVVNGPFVLPGGTGKIDKRGWEAKRPFERRKKHAEQKLVVSVGQLVLSHLCCRALEFTIDAPQVVSDCLDSERTVGRATPSSPLPVGTTPLFAASIHTARLT